MKKTLVFFALAFISMANAQKGTILVAGSIGITSTTETINNNENKYTYFSFYPKVGYQFTDKWTAGIETSYYSSKYKNNANYNNPTNENKQNGFTAGAFIRYTQPLNDTFSVYADLGSGFKSTSRRYTNFNGVSTFEDTLKGNGLYVQATPALFINFKKGFGLNFNIGGLGCENMHYEKNAGDRSSFNINFGQTVNVGISKNF